MADLALRAIDLAKTYRTNKIEVHALRGVSLEIPKGAFACIIGPSGHGKSTLLHLLGGLDQPTRGQVYLDSIELSGLNNRGLAELRAAKLGFVFQFYNLLEALTALENIEIAMMMAGASKKDQREKALNLLSQVGLSEKGGARPSELSGGQQQRVAIARALANDPQVLLMDEPTGNLDSKSAEEIMCQIDTIHRMGKTIVMVTHNSELARQAEMQFEVIDGRVNMAF